MIRSLVAALVFLAIFVAVGRASAAVVRDGAKMSIELGGAPAGAPICWVTPTELREPADCAGLSPDAVPPPAKDSARVIAMGLVRLEAPGDPPDLGLVMVLHVPMPVVREPDMAMAREYARGAEGAIVKELPPGATMRPNHDVQIVHPGKHPLVRAVFDVDGIAEDADEVLLEHQIHHTVMVRDGIYSVTWLTRRRSAAEVDAMADAAGATISVAEPAMSARDLQRTIGLVVLAIFGGGAIVVGLILVIILAPRRKVYGGPPAYPYPPAYPGPHAYPYPPHPQAHPPPHGGDRGDPPPGDAAARPPFGESR